MPDGQRRQVRSAPAGAVGGNGGRRRSERQCLAEARHDRRASGRNRRRAEDARRCRRPPGGDAGAIEARPRDRQGPQPSPGQSGSSLRPARGGGRRRPGATMRRPRSGRCVGNGNAVTGSPGTCAAPRPDQHPGPQAPPTRSAAGASRSLGNVKRRARGDLSGRGKRRAGDAIPAELHRTGLKGRSSGRSARRSTAPRSSPAASTLEVHHAEASISGPRRSAPTSVRLAASGRRGQRPRQRGQNSPASDFTARASGAGRTGKQRRIRVAHGRDRTRASGGADGSPDPRRPNDAFDWHGHGRGVQRCTLELDLAGRRRSPLGASGLPEGPWAYARPTLAASERKAGGTGTPITVTTV